MFNLFKKTTILSPNDLKDLKGGYIFSCEERKRHMYITCYTQEGQKSINTFRVAPQDADTFMANFNGSKKFKLEDSQN